MLSIHAREIVIQYVWLGLFGERLIKSLIPTMIWTGGSRGHTRYMPGAMNKSLDEIAGRCCALGWGPDWKIESTAIS
jgi:hypothetical protein